MRLVPKMVFIFCAIAIFSGPLGNCCAAADLSPYQIKLGPSAEQDEEDPLATDGSKPVEEEPELSEDSWEEVLKKSGTAKSHTDTLERARQLYNEKDYAQTIELIEPIIKDSPDNIQAWEILGWSYWRNGETEKTIDLWKNMAVIHGNRPEVHNMLGKAYISMDRLDEAIAAFEKSIELDPSQDKILYTLGAVNRWAGKLKRAVGILAECHLRNPEDRDTKLQLAKALMSSRLYGDALPLWQELHSSSPDDADILGQLSKALLHSGDFDAAAEKAGMALDLDADNSYALEVLATLSTHLDRPLDALEYQQRLLQVQTNPNRKVQVLGRIIEQDRLIWEARDGDYDLQNAVDASEQLLELKPDDINTHILLGEILMLQGKYNQAEEKLKYVLRHYNPNNIRAQRTLIEVYTVQKNFDEAEKVMRKMEAFNPRDPYLHYFKAQLAMAQGKVGEAIDHTRQLERKGARGAIAILLYHGLSTSKFDTLLTTERLEEQLRAFRDADYEFITPLEIEEYFEYRAPPPPKLDDYTPERVVIVTFDDARTDALELGTPVAKKLGVKFAMHVPPPYIDSENSFFADWDLLRECQQGGRWVFGSHLQHASDVAMLNKEGTRCRPLPNRLWLPEEQRKETIEEYKQRVATEYRESYKALVEKLGPECDPFFVAYPYGDIGQQTVSDVIDVCKLNLEQATNYYRIGFIQSRFGYAVKGDEPLLYQRHEPRQSESGAKTLAYTMANHPVFLARKMRAQFHALNGDSYAAYHMIDLLERDDYPESELDKLRRYVNSRLTGKGDLLDDEGQIRIARKIEPKLSAEVEYVDDSTDRANLRSTLGAGLRIFSSLEIGGFYGDGVLEQNYIERETGETIDLTVDETVYGGTLGLDIVTGDPLMSPVEIDMRAGQRDFSGDADYSESFYNAMINISPRPPLNMNLYYEHDVIPWARSVQAEKTYDNLQAMLAVQAADFWDLWGVYSNYDYSDENTADHINITSLWKVYEDWGLKAGLRYSHLSSDEERPDYWTPYKLNRYMALLECRRRISRTAFRLQLRAGIGKEEVRPETRRRYEENLADAIARNSAALPVEPKEEWTEVYGASLELSYALTEKLELRGEASYNELPDYDSTSLTGGIQYSF